MKWTRFEDPFEHAFSTDVPQGWTAKGGIFRLGFSDYRPMLDLQSPDGAIEIRTGDLVIPAAYALPTPYHREGDVNDLGAQMQGTFANYRTGKEFSQLYALTRFRTLCRSLTPREVDQTAPVEERGVSMRDHTRTSGGATSYLCESDRGPRIAYVYARTMLAPPLWQVPVLVSYLVTPDQEAGVRAALLHISQSFQLSPQWVEYQKKMDADALQYQIARQRQRREQLGQQVIQFEARMSAMRSQVGAFQRQQDRQARQVETWGNILTGITPTIDPLSGATRNVWTGPNSGYWINGLGKVVNSNVSPGAGFRPLQVQP